MKMNNDPERLKRLADLEDECESIQVGGLHSIDAQDYREHAMTSEEFARNADHMDTTQHMPELVGKEIALVEIIATNYTRLTFTDGTTLMIEADTMFVPGNGTMPKIDLSLGVSDKN